MLCNVVYLGTLQHSNLQKFNYQIYDCLLDDSKAFDGELSNMTILIG